jgi:hypothetical protein
MAPPGLQQVQGPKGNANASPVAIAALVIALLAFIAWLAYVNLFKPPGPPPWSAQDRANNATMIELAKKCQGDFGKLSPEDQAKARKMAGGYAGLAISKLYKDPNMANE